MSIFITSDWHFNHNREFIYRPRGFESVVEMNSNLLVRHNSVVYPDDDVYVLGDLCLGGGGNEAIIKNRNLIESMNGRLHIVLGNHDTAQRIEMYKNCRNVVEMCGYSTILEYRKYHFYLCHFPTMTGNLEKESLKQMTCCLYGHTHQQTNFYNGLPYCYHVGVDSHDCFPVGIEEIISDMKQEVKKCIDLL